MFKMTKRKKNILKAIINEYVMTAEPVGSRTLARRYNFGVSSATIRNDMADLEEANYLKQPHRSAGRIPTDKGYRFYVDALMDLKKLSKKQENLIKKDYAAKEQEIQELIQHTSQLLSQLTEYTSLVLSPQIQESIFQQLQLIPLSNKKILIILVTDSGLIKERIVDSPESINRKELDKISRFLNEKLRGLALREIDDELLSKLNRELINRFDLEDLNIIKKAIFKNNISSDGKIYLGGTTYILEQPEFSDLSKVKTVLEVFEHQKLLHQILKDSQEKSGLNIVIGSENNYEEIKDCSVVIATYYFNDRPIGKIGVLGPTRMEYAKAIGSVKFMADLLTKFLSD